MASAWSDAENDVIVADYLEMLRDELAGRAYSKAKHNRGVQEATGRGRGSVEFKHQNISAVLIGLGEPWIIGYKPAFNVQSSLADAVVRHLAGAAESFAHPPKDHQGDPLIQIGPPPTMRNAPPPKETEQLMAIARKFDVAAMQSANRVLGRAGEERVLRHERARLRQAGRDDLARDVRWVSDIDGDGAGYDIASFEETGASRLIEVKTTNGWERTPFHISHNELAVAEARADDWTLVRVWNFARKPRAFELRPPLAAHVSLMPTSYRAEFAVRQ